MKTEVSILHHQSYPPHVREFVADKLQHLVRYCERTESITARIERQREDHRVELVAHVRRRPALVVEGRAPHLEAALDLAVDRMARVLKRQNDSMHGGRRSRA